MKRNTRFSKTLYKAQSLTQPKAEYWPVSGKELLELSFEDTSFVAIGGGQHIEKKRLGPDSEVLRFGKMNDILNFDKLSMLARIEAGMSWGDYKLFAKERGLSTFQYRLYPNEATIGGIVSRRTQNSRSLWDGSLLNYCHGLRGISKFGDYRYLSAPRKASGPDLRSFWFGAAGRYGFVVDLTLGLFPVQEKLVLSASGNNDGELLLLPAILETMGVRSAWTHGSFTTEKTLLNIGFSGSKGRLNAIVDELRKQDFEFDYSFIHGSPCEEIRTKIEKTKWPKQSEKFVKASELKTLDNVTIVNSSLYGFTILSEHRSKKSRSKWSKNLNILTNTAGQK